MDIMDITIRNNIKRERERSPSDGPRRQRRVGTRFSSPRTLDSNVRSIIVTNIPFAFRWQELKDLFRENVGEVSFVEIFTDDTGKSRGSGVVEFETPNLAQLAVKKMNQVDVNGRRLVVKIDDGVKERIKPASSSLGTMMQFERGEWGRQDLEDRITREPDQDTSIVWGETYGLSQNFLAGLDIRGPLLTRVFIANLDYTVTRKKLKEVFKMAGRLLDIDLAVNSDSSSRGFATVDYEHPVEAVQAISLFNNQYLLGRKMAVRMDRRDRTTEAPRLPEGLSGIGMGLGENGIPLVDVARNLHSLAGTPSTANVTAPTLDEVVKTQLELIKSGIAVPRVGDGLFPGQPQMAAVMPFNTPQLPSLNDFRAPPMPSDNLGLSGPNQIDHRSDRYLDGNARHRELPLYTDRREEPLPFNHRRDEPPPLISRREEPPAFGSRRDDRQPFNNHRDKAPMVMSRRDDMPAITSRRDELPSYNDRRLSDRDLPHHGDRRNDHNAGNDHQRYSENDRVVHSSRNNNSLRANHQDDRGIRSDTILIKNLARNTTVETLREMYGEFGRVSYTEKQGPDSAIVRFFNDYDADQALLKTDGMVYLHRKLMVSYY